MRLSKLVFASIAAAALLGASAAQGAEPVKIRLSWVAPVTNWASIILEKKDLARHLGKSYTLEPVRFAGTPPMVTALANGELEVSNLAYSTLAIARHGRPAHHRGRVPRRRRRLLLARVHGSRRRPDQESRRSQGQGGDDQRGRQRRRRRHARDAAQVRPRGQARLHDSRVGFPDHARHAVGEEGGHDPRGHSVLL